jgi:chemotaxis methyl-accepting protein methylase
VLPVRQIPLALVRYVQQTQMAPADHRLLRENPDELARLSKDMLIGVTSFFRDEKIFEELREKVIAP